MDFADSSEIDQALSLVGEILAAEGQAYSICILGGAALNLLGIVPCASGLSRDMT